MASIFDFPLSNLPSLKAKGDCPGNLGPLILVKVSERNNPSAAIKYAPFFVSEANSFPLAITAWLMFALADLEMALFLSK